MAYGLGKGFENLGYIFEAASALCKWAVEQVGVSVIVAETNHDGFASHRVPQIPQSSGCGDALVEVAGMSPYIFGLLLMRNPGGDSTLKPSVLLHCS